MCVCRADVCILPYIEVRCKEVVGKTDGIRSREKRIFLIKSFLSKQLSLSSRPPYYIGRLLYRVHRGTGCSSAKVLSGADPFPDWPSGWQHSITQYSTNHIVRLFACEGLQQIFRSA